MAMLWRAAKAHCLNEKQGSSPDAVVTPAPSSFLPWMLERGAASPQLRPG